MPKYSHIILTTLVATLLTGCVERLITVTTRPPGAIVYLNDEEIGSTPVTVPFTWYGTYEVVIRKDNFATLKTTRNADAPFYQWPPLDLISECLLPFELEDHHQWDFELSAQAPADPNQLIERAKTLRTETLTTP